MLKRTLLNLLLLTVFTVQANAFSIGGFAAGAVPSAEAPSEVVARALCPEPGTALSPEVHDSIRTAAILKLIEDIYYGRDLPFSKDGTTFQNREGLLPQEDTGFYKEYTLLTGEAPHQVQIGDTMYNVSPDLGKRGSERVIIGGGMKVYYTPDHYRTFIELRIVR